MSAICRAGEREGFGDDVEADLLVALGLALAVLDGLDRAEERDAAAGDDALFGRGLGGVQGVVDQVLAFLHLGLGVRAGLHDRDAAGQLRQAFLELLAVVVAGGLLDLLADLLGAGLDLLLLAAAFDDQRVVLVDDDALGAGRGRSSSTFSSLRPRSSLMNLPPVTTARSPIIALRRSPKPGALTAQMFSTPRSLFTTSAASASALDVLGDDQQRPAAGDDLVQQRQQLGEVRRSSSRGAGCRRPRGSPRASSGWSGSTGER